MPLDRFRIVAIAAFCALVPLAAASQTTYYVATDGSDENACLSPMAPCRTIQGAVDRAADGDDVHVKAGTYAESVSIQRRRSLTIHGEPDTILTPPGGGSPPAGSVLLNLWSSNHIQLYQLTFQGAGDSSAWGAISVNESSAVLFEGLAVQDFGGGGVVLYRNASVALQGSTVRRNRSFGIRVDAGSQVRIGSADAAASVVIEDNQFQGIALAGTLSLRGHVVVQRNFYGVYANGGTIESCCGEGSVDILDNSEQGIRMVGGHLALKGPVLIQGNDFGGIELVASTAFLNQWNLGTVVVRNNGGAGIALSGSHLEGRNIEVTGNASHGILAQDVSSARLISAVVSNNGADGIHAEAHSTIRLIAAVTATGNLGADVSCSVNSSGAGGVAGIGKLACRDFEKLK